MAKLYGGKLGRAEDPAPTGPWKLGPYNLIVEASEPVEKGWTWLYPKGGLHCDEREEPKLFSSKADAERVLDKSHWAGAQNIKIVFVRSYAATPASDNRRTYVIEAWRES